MSCAKQYPCGDGAYVRLMDEYPLVTSVYNELPDGHRCARHASSALSKHRLAPFRVEGGKTA